MIGAPAGRQGAKTPPARGALKQRAAEQYLGMGEGFLDDYPIPRVDLRRPGATRPVWVYRLADLDQLLAERLVEPGHPNPLAG